MDKNKKQKRGEYEGNYGYENNKGTDNIPERNGEMVGKGSDLWF